MFGFIKHVLIALFSFGRRLATECVSLYNQPRMARSTLINLNTDEMCEGLHCHSFMASLDRCDRSSNTLNNLFDKIYIPKKVEGLNLNVFSTIARMNELKTLIKHISCHCKCKFKGEKFNSKLKRNSGKCQCEFKKQ